MALWALSRRVNLTVRIARIHVGETGRCGIFLRGFRDRVDHNGELPKKLVLTEKMDARQSPAAPSNAWTVEQILA